MKLSERMEHVGQEAYEYAPEVAQLEAENAALKRENKALRANTSKSVLRRLDIQLEEQEDETE